MRRPERGLTLRTALLLIGLGALLYVAVIGAVVDVLITPTASAVPGQSERLTAELDGSRVRAITLRSTASEARQLLSFGRTGGIRPGDLDALRTRVRLFVDDATAAQRISSVSGLPDDMRVALARAADRESQVGVSLSEALAEIDLQNYGEAENALNRCDSLQDLIASDLSEAQRLGLVHLTERESSLGLAARRAMKTVVWWIVLGLTLIPLLALFVRQRLYLPLAGLDRALGRVAKGDLSASVQVRRNDELGRFARHFNQMTEVLRRRAEEERLRAQDRTEAAVRASEERLRLAIDAAQMSPFDWNIFTGEVRREGATYKASGPGVDDPGETADELVTAVHPADRERIRRGMLDAVAEARSGSLKEGSLYSADYRVVLPDGEVRWRSTLGRIYRDESGRPARMTGVSRDITESKRAEVALQESEALFRAVAESNAAAIFIYRGTRCLYVNSPAEGVTGYSHDELMAMEVGAIAYHEDAERLRGYGEARQRGEPVPMRFETRFLTKNGDLRWLDITVTQIEYEGAPAFLATAFDITDSKRAEEALRESEARFRAVAESIAAAVFIFRGTRRLYVNTPAERVTGYSPDELMAMQVGAIAYHEDAERVRGYREARQKGEPAPTRYETRSLRKDGDLRWFDITVTQIEYEGEPAFLETAFDITDLKHAEQEIRKLNEELEHRVAERTQQLHDVNRELEAFSYSVSHDMRAPLRAIDGFSLALLEDCGDQLNQTAKGYFGRIRAASQRMGRLIDDMLQLSRITRSDMHQAAVDLSALAAAISDDLKAGQPERQVAFRIQPGLVVQGDARLLHVLLENLLGNAWKFTAKKARATIELGAAEREGERAFFVRDDGAGFDMTYSHKLFVAFNRLHSESEFTGTGIGLATVQRIVHRHGGRVWAEGAIGRGATLYFTL